MNLPNLISAGRILLVPVFVFCYLKVSTASAMAVLLLSALSDIMDGFIARRFNMVTDLGKILDPVADKLIQAAMMLCLALRFPQIWLLLAVHVFRELMLAAMGYYVMRSTGNVNCAKWYGKLCTVFIYAVMLGLLVYPQLPEARLNSLLLCCGAWMVVCMLLYFAEYLRMLKKQAGTDY